MPYAPNARFADPARSKPELWRIPAATAVMVIIAFLLQALFVSLLLTTLINDTPTTSIIWEDDPLGASSTMAMPFAETPVARLGLLAVFGTFLVGLAVALRALHQRPLGSLLGDRRYLASDTIRVTLACLILIGLLAVLLPSPVDNYPNPNLSGGQWALLLLAGVPLIALQSGTEELFFRGYLQQQLAARFSHRAVCIAVPSVLFGLAHLSEVAGPNMWHLAIWATAFGLAAADLTARTGNIGAALGMHFANNLIAMLLIAPKGYGSGLALWHMDIEISDPALQAYFLPQLASIFCTWLAARLALRV
ncbi:CPBP family intramembrane metalloprotease [Alphaproteobacteria bacterium KMM 3653]|uniref:CPBP family intramembrane metalloprotease n=1 Tax=Harenicola maris TaxID=2841044 RepID=A0AAP2G7J7_9RHOB|nr:CPBP family intramembrane metalloprotease [Harenicola maris]